MLQGLETGHATLGVVGTVSRSLVPPSSSPRCDGPRPGSRCGSPKARRNGSPVEVADARARERRRHRTGERPAPARRAPARRGARRVACRSRLRVDATEPITLRALARETVDPAARGQPAARRGRNRGARREGRAPRSDRGRRCASHRRPRRGRRRRLDPARDGGPDDQRGLRPLRIAHMPPRRLALVTAARRAALARRPGRARRRRATSCAANVATHELTRAATKRVPITRRVRGRGLRLRGGRRRAARRAVLRDRMRAPPRPHEVDRVVGLALRRRLAARPRRTRRALDASGVRSTTRRSVQRGPAAGSGSTHQRRVHVRSVLAQRVRAARRASPDGRATPRAARPCRAPRAA